MGLAIVSTPAEPVTAAQAMAHCRVTDQREEELFTRWVKAARRLVEKHTGRQLCSATWRLTMSAFPPGDIELERSPVQSVTSITYVDTAGDTQTLSTDEYTLDTTEKPPIISVYYSWPSNLTSVYNPAAVTVDFVAGYGAAADVPETYQQAILLQVAQWFEGRADPGEFSKAAEALCNLEWDGSW